jgi:menaquinone-dependent protoporphyrinogen oxidase
MKVLVAYASRHGATRGIAERIGAKLEVDGLEVTTAPVAEAADVLTYDAYVIGSAAYMGHWLKEATAFTRRHRSLLARRPTWIFSSGPVGTDTVDTNGRDVREASEPKEWAELREGIRPRDMHVFYGAYDPEAEPIGFAEQVGGFFLRMMPGARSAIPAGDFRDWDEIEGWADAIHHELAQVATQPAV